ncbi:twin-arginine translocase subunit TatC [Compostimonas suwonensis]|uniref:Sec-independent protein translocase protein TatC n=1 Tax=Compostimonas suwonensis TaxID=1048394 RepID=A0A2M9BYU8_9MICO|nr:twin-arginine translocase subunit TatC [Compostimonas suwonensis]PJJ63252.1 sec-independent protein translocase protein TatC [Compostimonas suwonensis]
MSLAGHLLELRKRLYIAAAALVVASVGGWFVSDLVLDILNKPIELIVENQGRNAALNYTAITSSFDLKIQIAFTVGVIVSSPVWLYQIWAFLVPGLTRKELRYGLGFFLTAVPLFLAGCAAGWFVYPHIVELLTSFAPSESTSFINAKDYFDFILKLVLAVGVAFILPVFLVLLNFVGVLSARSIIKGWRIAILAIVLFTAIATPAADVFSMFLLAIPMVLLYLLAAGVAWLHDRRAQKRALDFDDVEAIA